MIASVSYKVCTRVSVGEIWYVLGKLLVATLSDFNTVIRKSAKAIKVFISNTINFTVADDNIKDLNLVIHWGAYTLVAANNQKAIDDNLFIEVLPELTLSV